MQSALAVFRLIYISKFCWLLNRQIVANLGGLERESSSDSSVPVDEWRSVDIEQLRPAANWSWREPCHRPAQRRRGGKSEEFGIVVLDRRKKDFAFAGHWRHFRPILHRVNHLGWSCRR